MPIRSGHEDSSTVGESESRVRTKKFFVKRRLLPLSERRGLRDPAVTDRTLLEHAFDEGLVLVDFWKFPVFFHFWFSLHRVFCKKKQFAADFASNASFDSGYQFVSLCWSIYEKKKSELVDPLMSRYCVSVSNTELLSLMPVLLVVVANVLIVSIFRELEMRDVADSLKLEYKASFWSTSVCGLSLHWFFFV